MAYAIRTTIHSGFKRRGFIGVAAALVKTAFAAAIVSASSGHALAEMTAPPACGNIQAVVNAVALPDNGMGPHQQSLNQTWLIPAGAFNQYVNPDGAIVTQNYPSNGGSQSFEYLKTVCTVTSQDKAPPIVELVTTASSALISGHGTGTGASSDYDTRWFVVTNLPALPNNKSWSLSVVGIINASNVNPTCSVTVNNGASIPLPTGPFIRTFNNLSGTAAVFVSCSQGHIAIFASGPNNTTAYPVVNSDVTLSFTHQ